MPFDETHKEKKKIIGIEGGKNRAKTACHTNLVQRVEKEEENLSDSKIVLILLNWMLEEPGEPVLCEANSQVA